MGLSIQDVLGKVKRPVRIVRVCLDGDLWERHDELTQKMDAARGQNPGKLGSASGVAELSAQLREVELAMAAAQVEFKFRGISSYKLEEIQARFPARDGGRGWNGSEGAPALLAACALEPEMTEEEARQLLEEVSEAHATRLYNGAWLATTGSGDVPFSVRAFGSTSDSGSK